MRNINEVTLLGRAGKDAEVRTFDSGAKIVKFSLATSRNWKKNDEWQSETTWHNISVFGRPTEEAEQVKKGQLVMIQGRIKINEWDDENGNKRRATEIVAFTCARVITPPPKDEYGNTQQQSQSQQSSYQSTQVQQSDPALEDIPW